MMKKCEKFRQAKEGNDNTCQFVLFVNLNSTEKQNGYEKVL